MKRNSIVLIALIGLAVIAGSVLASSVPVNTDHGFQAIDSNPAIGIQDQTVLSVASTSTVNVAYNADQSAVADQPAAADVRVWHDQYAAAAKSYGLSTNISGVGLDRSSTTQPTGGAAQGIHGSGGVF